ncbi:MAG: thioredoxin domain-containing protein [Brevundimonas sp.]|uniref:thioredoxin domain-containing protein n=1 Tax=Brevundimonas sp. TaxID=1871086 RepID=UPI004034D561
MIGTAARLTRAILAATVLMLGSLTAAPALAQMGPPRVTAADHTIGDPNAPVTVIEYGSLACPYCAEWQMGSWYDFKARFVDTGQVRFVFREILTEPTDLAATAAAVARCSAPERYFEVLHVLFRWQSTARNFGPVSEWYDRAIAESGRPEAQVRACVNDPATLRAIEAVQTGGVAAGVRKTPTFFVNGVIAPDHSAAGLAAAIAAAR